MGRPKSEVRQMTEGVFVRFTKADKEMLEQEAEKLGISVPELLRDSGIERVREGSLVRAAS